MATYQEIIQQLQNKDYQPLYLLYGQEAFFIDKISDYIQKNVLTEAEKGFNQTVFYGRDVEIRAVIETCKRFPMMSERQVVIIKEAQDLKNLDALEDYANQPMPSTILVLAYKYKKPDGRKKVVKSIKKNGVVFESKPIYENQMQGWISNYIHQFKRQITPNATMLIGDFIGTNLTLASNEIDKLFLTIPEGDTIDEDSVSRVIGINKDYNNFELQKALGHRNYLKSMKIANYFSQNQKEHPLVATIAVLGRYYTNLMLMHFSPQAGKGDLARMLGVNPYFVEEFMIAKSKNNGQIIARNIELIREYDLKSKGVNSGAMPSGELLKELVFKLLQ